MVEVRNISLQHLADQSGVSRGTMRGWRIGRAVNIYFLDFALAPLGYRLALEEIPEDELSREK